MRVGLGSDGHSFARGRRLVLGGIDIPFDKGLDGHSDADVLVHAIIDALLGAAGLGDIGTHFPSSEPEYKDISSIALLRQVGSLLQTHGWQIENIDATIVAEQPQLSPFIPRMRQRISETLGISLEKVGVKSTTSKGLGFVGKGEGIAAHAVALVEKLKRLRKSAEGK
ncbi:MAG: 2-C-methyl-D-erythritol 2,4-cyclodiphosphate synthase [Dehalococcoidia bacterium]|nr:MAG: 2-C-methyl-D-erythritol 2,4-cyclodiphosphate synthase [Dehalococcoidia bacterium]